MKFTANKKYFFYPDINGNLDLPEDERLAIEIIRPTAEDRNDVAWPEGTSRAGSEGKETGFRIRFDVGRILRNHVGAIKNMAVEDENSPGKETAISNGKELARASFLGMVKLVDLICSEVCRDVLTDGQKKILESDSASSGTNGTSGN